MIREEFRAHPSSSLEERRGSSVTTQRQQADQSRLLKHEKGFPEHYEFSKETVVLVYFQALKPEQEPYKKREGKKR